MDLGIEERVNIDLFKASSTDNINLSQKGMFGMNLLWYASIVEYVTYSRMKNTRKWLPCVLSV